MTDDVPKRIIVRYSDIAGQWQAWFDRSPCVTYGGEHSMDAVHRLLEGYDTDACDLVLRVDRDQAGNRVLTC